MAFEVVGVFLGTPFIFVLGCFECGYVLERYTERGDVCA